MALSVYKPNQGFYARGAAGMGILLLALFASVRFFQMLGGKAETFALAGLAVPYNAIWAAVVFVAIGALVSVLTFGVETGMAGIDSKVRAYVDLLVDTQAELQKVSWPAKEELRSSTMVVMVCIVLLGCYLYVVDIVVSFVMTNIGVLPK